MLYRDIVLQAPVPTVRPVIFGYEAGREAHRYGPAVRTYWLIHYVTGGRGYFTIHGKTHTVTPGMLFIIPPYTEISYVGDKTNNWDYIWIGFHLTGEAPGSLHSPVVSCPAAGQVFERMKDCKGRVLPLSSCILELFGILEAGSSMEKDYVAQAVSCIQAEYAQELTVEQIAARLGLDRSYFSDIFRDKMGIPPGKYLIRLRMEKAAELMTVHGYTPTLAAQSCGYPDFSQFSKRFKAHFGISPREYRKSHENLP